VNVVTIPYPEYQDRLVIAVRGGTPPDVSTVDQIWNYGFATGGAIVPLDNYIAGSDTVKEENFFPGAWASAAFEDQVWGVPSTSMSGEFILQQDAVRRGRALIPEPVTWDGLKAAGEALTDAQDGKYGIGSLAHLGEDTVVVMNRSSTRTAALLAEDGSCALDEPEAVEALNMPVAAALCARKRGPTPERHARAVLNGSLATEW
jgi:multiple sugar transport system substrate-binding protein